MGLITVLQASVSHDAIHVIIDFLDALGLREQEDMWGCEGPQT